MKANKISMAILTIIFAMGVIACQKGPAEKAGEKIDNATEKMGDKLEEAGDKIKEKTD